MDDTCMSCSGLWYFLRDGNVNQVYASVPIYKTCGLHDCVMHSSGDYVNVFAYGKQIHVANFSICVCVCTLYCLHSVGNKEGKNKKRILEVCHSILPSTCFSRAVSCDPFKLRSDYDYCYFWCSREWCIQSSI